MDKRESDANDAAAWGGVLVLACVLSAMCSVFHARIDALLHAEDGSALERALAGHHAALVNGSLLELCVEAANIGYEETEAGHPDIAAQWLEIERRECAR